MTNTEYLMRSFGWQGGTVHQVSRRSGISVMAILDLHRIEIKNENEFQKGLHSHGIIKEQNPCICFWIGVLHREIHKGE